MIALLRRGIRWFLIATIAVATSSVFAQSSIVVPPGYENTWGGGGRNTTTRDLPRSFQLIFPASQLGSLQPGDSISAIAWRSAESVSISWPPQDITWTNYDVYMGAAAVPRESQSTTFADNRGAGFTQVRNGSLTLNANTINGYNGQGTPGPFEFVVPFDTPFIYAGGDLLLEVRHTGHGEDLNSDPSALSMDRTSDSVPANLRGTRLSESDFNAVTGTIDDDITIIRFSIQRTGAGAQPIPTLSQWGTIMMAMLMIGILGMHRRRRNN